MARTIAMATGYALLAAAIVVASAEEGDSSCATDELPDFATREAPDIVEVERATLDECSGSGDSGGPGGPGGPSGAGGHGTKSRRHVTGGVSVGFISVPVTWSNIGSVSLLLLLAVIGSVAVWAWLVRKSCRCKLCRKTYTVVEPLGKGGFGRLYTARRAESSALLVLKMVLLDDLTQLDVAQIEAKQLRSLRHPHIVRYMDDFVHTTWGGIGEQIYVCIVMEWCAQDLRTAIAERARDDPFDEETVLRWLAQMCSALNYCHHKGVFHRDVKTQNVFLTKSGDIRVGDFGLCRPAPGLVSYSDGGTDTYMPPEVMLGQKLDGKKVDVWCAGLVLYELMSLTFVCEHAGLLGALAIKDASAVETLLRTVPEEYGFSPEIGKVARRFLAVNPSARPSFDETLKKKLLKRFIKPGGSHRSPHKQNHKRATRSGSGSKDEAKTPSTVDM
eukprot:g3373.t1